MSKKLPATAHTTATAPRVTDLMRMKRRLDPSLDKPYFVGTNERNGCIHAQFGVRLDKTAQRAYCLKCGTEISLFDALWNYHHAEERLVATLEGLDRHDQQEAERKERDQKRRPFMRAVKDFKPVRDMTLKTEPVVARIYTLECGHTRKLDGDRDFKKVHCSQCQMEANTVRGGSKQ